MTVRSCLSLGGGLDTFCVRYARRISRGQCLSQGGADTRLELCVVWQRREGAINLMGSSPT
jgi:hypothetical protein